MEGEGSLHRQLQRLARHSREQEARLASWEFKAMLRQIHEGTYLYQPRSLTQGTSAETYQILNLKVRIPARPLDVPLGHIARSDDTSALGVVGIVVTHDMKAALQAALASLFSEHHKKPFAKLVFLTDMLSILPFLGQYGFAYWYQKQSFSNEIFETLHQRYALVKVMSLTSGEVLWAAESGT